MRKNNSKAHSLDSFRTEPEQLSDPPTPRGPRMTESEELMVEASAMAGYNAVAFSTNDNN